MWEKAHGLALIMFGFSFVLQLLLSVIAELLGAKSSGVGFIVHFVSAYTIGQVYASKQQRTFPEPLRFQTTLYYTGLATATSIIFLFVVAAIEPRAWFAPLLGIITPFIVFPSIYWGLSSGAKAYLKKINK